MKVLWKESKQTEKSLKEETKWMDQAQQGFLKRIKNNIRTKAKKMETWIRKISYEALIGNTEYEKSTRWNNTVSTVLATPFYCIVDTIYQSEYTWKTN